MGAHKLHSPDYTHRYPTQAAADIVTTSHIDDPRKNYWNFPHLDIMDLSQANTYYFPDHNTHQYKGSKNHRTRPHHFHQLLLGCLES